MEQLTLQQSKDLGQSPEWLTEEGYKTLMSGYTLEGESPKDLWERVTNASAARLGKPELAPKFFELIWKNWLCLASPVASNMGTDRGLPISCYGGYVGDSIDEIMTSMHEAAMLSKNGGGLGYFYGGVRHRGAPIKNNGYSNGVVPAIKILDSITVGVSQGGCYEEGTQILTAAGFKDFRDLQPDDLIAQFDKERNISFTKGEKTVREWEGDMYRIHHPRNLNIGVTPNHRMMIEREKQRNYKGYWPGYLEEVSAEDVNFHRNNRMHAAALRKAPSSLTPLERFRIAYQADGCKGGFQHRNSTFKMGFNFSKERKISRFKEILKECELDYKEKLTETGSSFSVVCTQAHYKPTFDWVKIEDYDSAKAAAFLLEVAEWDGSWKKAESFQYSSIVKENVDKLEALAVIAGYRTTRTVRPAKGNRVDLYGLFFHGRYRGLAGDGIVKEKYHYKGKVYCCIVPEGRIAVKDRDGNILICGNTRRGASSAYLPIEHPDFEEFMEIRRVTGGDDNLKCMNIHHAVTIGDEFMQKLMAGDPEAREKWRVLITTRFETGEPYIMFRDTVDRARPESYKNLGLKVHQSQLCSEILLHSDVNHTFVCGLSSMNAVTFNEWKETNAVQLAIWFLDGMMEEFIVKARGRSGFEKAVRFAEKSRAIGLGILGLHSLFQQEDLPFESFEAYLLNGVIFKHIREQADKATQDLAKEYGEPEWCKGTGRRHTHCLAVAPTATNSVISGNVSQGIEPLAANAFSKKTGKGTFLEKNKRLKKLLESLGKDTREVWLDIVSNGGSVQHLDFLTDHQKAVYKTAREIDQLTIVKLAAQRQKFIDQGQSLNLFFSPDESPKYINKVHLEAWKQGLQTLYYVRSSSVLKGDKGSRAYKREETDCTYCEG